MDIAKYFRSRSAELSALRDRVREFSANPHWQTDGEWKESVLRAALRDSLPETIRVGRGFIVGGGHTSKQIDVLLYDSASPAFFRDGDLVFIPPDHVRGIIEVKSKVNGPAKLSEALKGIAENRSLLPQRVRSRVVTGLFAYEATPGAKVAATEAIPEECGTEDRLTNLVCLGPDWFARYWEQPPTGAEDNYCHWHTYALKKMAFGYFIHNVLVHVSPNYSDWRGNIWFPETTKEIHLEERILAPWLRA